MDMVKRRGNLVGWEEKSDRQREHYHRHGYRALFAFDEQAGNDEVFVQEIGDIQPADKRAEKHIKEW